MTIMRWDYDVMLDIGKSLFNQIYRKKRLTNHNHDIHFLSRNMNEWLHKGIKSLISGAYTPDFVTRYYFKDEMVEQLPIQDRVLQHILLKVIKPTFKYITNPRCYHLAGPTGVKHATAKIKSALQGNKY